MRRTSIAIATLTLLAVPALAIAGHNHGHAHAAKAAATPKTVQIEVTDEGFVPAKTQVKQGQPVSLVVTRKTDRTCAKEIVIKEHGVNQPLPLNAPVTVTITPKEKGELRYACAMGHISGVLVVE